MYYGSELYFMWSYSKKDRLRLVVVLNVIVTLVVVVLDLY